MSFVLFIYFYFLKGQTTYSDDVLPAKTDDMSSTSPDSSNHYSDRKNKAMSFLPKKFQFLSNFNATNLTNTFKTPTNQLTNPKNPKQGSKIRNQTRLDLSSST
jgi:hypothetical protein